MFAFAAWANDLALGLGLEAKGTSGGPFEAEQAWELLQLLQLRKGEWQLVLKLH